MKIKEHLDKDNLHHAYLIEGEREEIIGEVLEFITALKIDTTGNADVSHISLDSFKIDDARNLKSLASEKGFSDGKRIFIISTNNFLLEAQHSLLKMFEEPIENTHFFIITPDASIFIKTLISRVYFISAGSQLTKELKDAEKFIGMPLRTRIDFIKELLAEPEEEDEDGNEIVVLDSARSKALKFLNALESVLHSHFKNSSGLLQPSAGIFPVQNFKNGCFEHFLKVRQFLRMPGSSAKSLMESVALVVPEKI